jgi:hypothetical protein
MIEQNLINTQGQPLRLHELNIEALAEQLHSKGIRFTNGKKIGEVIKEGKPSFIGFHNKQRQVIEDPSRFKVVAFGRRSGKSAMATLLALAAVLQPNRKIWIVGPEYIHVEKIFNELYSILVVQLKWIKKGANDGTAARRSKGDYLIQLANGSTIEGKSASNPDSMAGDPLDLIIFDEAALCPNLNIIWRQMLRPTLTDKKGSAVFISSPRGKNDFYKYFKLGELGMREKNQGLNLKEVGEEEENTIDWASWQMASKDNPFIPVEEYEAERKEAILTGNFLTFKQEWDADFDSVSDAAFPTFKASLLEIDPTGKELRKPYHVQKYNFNIKYGPWFAACDFNLARPASTIYAQVDQNNNVIIFDELFQKDTDAYLQGHLIKEKIKEIGVPPLFVIGDISGSFKNPSGINSFSQMEKGAGIKPVGRKQGRETGSHLINRWLAFPILDQHGFLVLDEFGKPKTYPKLFVAEHCLETIHALETAKRKMGKDNTPKEDYDEFQSGHEGLLDALRYLMCYLFHETPDPIQVYKGIY